MATVQDYLNNVKWVKRVDESFNTININKNGYISMEDWLICVNNLAKALPAHQAEIAKLQAIMMGVGWEWE